MAAARQRITFTCAQNQAFDGVLQRWDCTPDSTETDLHRVLDDFSDTLEERIRESVRKYRAIKLEFIVTVTYQSDKFKERQPFHIYLHSTKFLIYQENEIAKTVDSINREIQSRNENAVRNESQVKIIHIDYLTLMISQFQPLAASRFQELPEFLKKKRAIINVKNQDNKCFGYAILSALMASQDNPSAAVLSNPTRATTYRESFRQYGLHDLEYPVQPDRMFELENKLNLKINLFSFYDDVGTARYPMYISKRTNYTHEIDLLYWNEHYAWIKHFSAFIHDLSPSHDTKFFCKRCFGLFLSKETMTNHQEYCSRADYDGVLYRFPPPGSMVKFQNIRYQAEAPFVIYADFESLILDDNQALTDPAIKKTKYSAPYGKHIPCAVGLYVKSQSDAIYAGSYQTYTGKDVINWFLNRLLQIANEIVALLTDEKRLVMRPEDWALFNATWNCTICQKPITDPTFKVRDHDHLTGRFRGAAHAGCNLQYQQTHKIPVFIHNFRGYDAHLITLGLDKFPDKNLSIIGQGFEKYLTLRFGTNLVFKDTFQFMASSLDQLAKDLLGAGAEKFVNLKKVFPNISDEQFKLLLRKGVYPYEYMNKWERLDEQALPAIADFTNTLRQSTCSVEDYQHAQHVWNEFGCRTMRDYQNLYLKTDVMILTDVFENFRHLGQANYRLDAAHYVSSPQLSWDAMLLFTGCELELISDPEMFNLISPGIRGGVSMIVRRYAKANNPEMGAAYDPSSPLSYIVYLDANNLYGWAMQQSLPIGGFKFVPKEEWAQIDWLTLDADAPVGYFLNVDLEYPKELHDAHSDYPLAPERILLQYEMLNETQLKILRHYQVPKSGLRVHKLVPHLMVRKNYMIHYRNLRFYLEEGMKLTAIHAVLQFNQSKWLFPYIQKNTDLRAQAKTDFDKNQYKLYNNAIYGKTCENQKKRSDIRLVNTKSKCKRLVEKPHMKGFRIFTDNLAAVDLRKVNALIDKPFYVGFVVLELSKLHMYNYHYRYIKAKLGDKAKLLFTDTDSLMYHVEGVDPYEIFKADRKEWFDFASFPKEHKCYSPENNKVIGMFKDEAGGAQITEFVGLRPKMYSFMTTNPKLPQKHVAKGIQYAVAKSIQHADYLEQLQRPKENRLANRRIASKLHQLYSHKTEKRGLCAFDDKRVILEDGISTLPYGHYQVTGQEVEIGLPENQQRMPAFAHTICCPREVRTDGQIERPAATQSMSQSEYHPRHMSATMDTSATPPAPPPHLCFETQYPILMEEDDDDSEDEYLDPNDCPLHIKLNFVYF